MAKRKETAVEETSSDDSYDALLNRAWSEVAEPTILPGGNWRLTVRNASFVKPKEGSENKTPQILFFLVPTEPVSDVDQDKLDELGENYDYTVCEFSHSIWLRDGGDWADAKDLFRKLGFDEDVSIQESIKGAKERTVIGYLGSRNFQDKRTGGNRTAQTVLNFTADE